MDTRTDAERYADTIANELEELELFIRNECSWPEDEPGTDPLESWTANLLDVDAEVSLTTGTVRSVTLTRTIGGPGCWIECDGDEHVRVVASWGSDRAYRTVYAPSVSEWAWEWAEHATGIR